MIALSGLAPPERNKEYTAVVGPLSATQLQAAWLVNQYDPFTGKKYQGVRFSVPTGGWYPGNMKKNRLAIGLIRVFRYFVPTAFRHDFERCSRNRQLTSGECQRIVVLSQRRLAGNKNAENKG